MTNIYIYTTYIDIGAMSIPMIQGFLILSIWETILGFLNIFRFLNIIDKEILENSKKLHEILENLNKFQKILENPRKS